MKTKNKLASGIVALSVIALTMTGCHNGDTGNSEANSAPTVSATAPASAQESAKATESSKASTEATKPVKDRTKAEEKAIESQAMADMMEKYGTASDSIDVDKAIKDADPSLNKTFPKSKFDQKAAVAFGLKFMDDLIATENFYTAKPSWGSDWKVLESSDFSDRMDGDFLIHEKESIKKNGYQQLVIGSNAEGLFGTTENSKHQPVKLKFDGIPYSSWNTPDVSAGRASAKSTNDNKNGQDAIIVEGTRTVDMKFTNGAHADKVKVKYNFSVIPTGKDSFLMSGMGHSYDNIQVKGIK